MPLENLDRVGPPDCSRELALIGAPSWFGVGRDYHSLSPAPPFVELIGIEPTTSGLQSQRSPN